MFGKLVKHEFRSGMRTFLPIWGGMVVLSLLTGLTIKFADGSLASSTFAGIGFVLLMLLAISLLIATAVLAVIYIIRRFASGLLGNEGYLMFTLPVTSGQLLGSRVLTAFLYELISVLVACLSGLIILLIADTDTTLQFFRQFFPMLGLIVQKESMAVLLIIEFVVIILAMILEAIMRIQMSICLGHLFRKGRAGFSILMYVALSWTLEIVITVVLMSKSMNAIMEQMNTAPTAGTIAAYTGIFAGSMLVLCAVYYFIMNSILKKKLNLM